uniref:DUSP domain-containing protein n=1 Tax=Aplanochytrium stocchinoi TaxID=215587 RepID=A0A7S3LMB8_9STRA|mmetsp:Transcript_18430/g.22576  ORF Transcript_18430/g.22576 Transcript_18430/m.22576 type:complete len:420 (+) Transcript_18430:731-1990(+)|eukprot:CAMPEP_0204824102 /NCGR_PEP_ID=MMETSP1346-20131115/2147_1 /ASSEMBLY_ACC=CAM_ASM_000771 /TAXON_ID=215587 /ORGANISM="Aplanochytrium stocchinoi, Strain GSBS06" /LENGTH=419 /DNA_ID=CAMNT_0051951065 /DNA_START=556 /DNA_END=1815 /DNA_ORIENTATION=+
MGNLQTLLGECQIGELPAYVKEYLAKAEEHLPGRGKKDGSGGDEAYIVYAESLSLPNTRSQSANMNMDRNFRNPYTGPNHTYVNSRAALLQEENSRSINEDRQLLSDIVDLVVDGIDSPSIRRERVIHERARSSNDIPGGEVYSLPVKNKRVVKTDVWEEAKSRVDVTGSHVRASPLDEGNNDGIDDDLETAVVADVYVNDYDANENFQPKTNVNKVESSLSQAQSLQAYVEADSEYEYEEIGQHHQQQQATPKNERETETENEKKTKKKMTKKRQQRNEVVIDSDEENEQTEENEEAQNEGKTMSSPLDICRQEEVELRSICHIVALPFEMDEEAEMMKKWYIVEAEWFRHWSKFLQGAARPGPIINEKLLTEDNDRPWPGLLPGEHYFGMDEQAWNFLADRYGADIAICRNTYDIYE